jgi:tuftelin-interacting protein 11
MSNMHTFAQNSSSESEESDYNPLKRRRLGKESAALGVFGSDSEDEAPKKKFRTKGTAFVSAGQKELGSDEDDDNEDEDEEEEEENVEMNDGEEDEKPPGLGLGFGTPKGMGFRMAARGNKSTSNQGTPLGRGFVPSSAAAPVLLDEYDNEVETPRIARPSAFSTPASGKGGKQAHAAAAPNKMSFAARMMAKMGHVEGQGLGKDGQGRTGSIEVNLRPSKVGLGAVREMSQTERDEAKRQAKLMGIVLEDSDEERRKKKTKPKTSGTDSGFSTPKRNAKAKPKYQTLADVEKAAPGLEIPLSFTKILDMTGPAKKLLTSSSGLMTPTAGVSATDTVERKLARRAQSDMSAFIEEWKSLQERKLYTELTIVQEKQEIETLQLGLDPMRSLSLTVENTLSVKDREWEQVLEALISADGFSVSQHNEILSDIAVSAVHPFLREFCEGWSPLEEPTLCGKSRDLFKIRHILGATTAIPTASVVGVNLYSASRSKAKSSSTYESMIYKIIFPKIVSALTHWDVHDPTPVLNLFQAWEGLVFGFVHSQIIEAVVRKLEEAISSWKPRKNSIHLWLFPLLPFLPERHTSPNSSSGLVTDIKRKLRQTIDQWDFSRGLISGFGAWSDVLGPEWEKLKINHVIPSMSRWLDRNFQVSPQDQDMRGLNGVLAWTEIVGNRVMGQVIVEKIFSHFHLVLHEWLTSTSRNYEEIGAWFTWWSESVFPPDIIALPAIQHQFELGQKLIHDALDLGSRAATHLPAPTPMSAVPAKTPSPPPAPFKHVEEITFKDRVEDWCIENDLILSQERKQLHAQALYRLTASSSGKNGVLVYFKGDSLFAVQPNKPDFAVNWVDEDSRDALLGMAYTNVK